MQPSQAFDSIIATTIATPISQNKDNPPTPKAVKTLLGIVIPAAIVLLIIYGIIKWRKSSTLQKEEIELDRLIRDVETIISNPSYHPHPIPPPTGLHPHHPPPSHTPQPRIPTSIAFN
jgi:hypothetical protein